MFVVDCIVFLFFLFYNQKTVYEMRISDWSSDVCSSDLCSALPLLQASGNLCLCAVNLSKRPRSQGRSPCPPGGEGGAACSSPPRSSSPPACWRRWRDRKSVV